MRPKQLDKGVILVLPEPPECASEQRPAGLRSAHRCFLGLPLWQMRRAWLVDNVGMCVSSVLHYEHLLLACTLGSARGCLGSACIFSAPENNFAHRSCTSLSPPPSGMQANKTRTHRTLLARVLLESVASNVLPSLTSQARARALYPL